MTLPPPFSNTCTYQEIVRVKLPAVYLLKILQIQTIKRYCQPVCQWSGRSNPDLEPTPDSLRGRTFGSPLSGTRCWAGSPDGHLEQDRNPGSQSHSLSIVIVIVIVSTIQLKWELFDFRNYCITAYTFYSYKLIFAKLHFLHIGFLWCFKTDFGQFEVIVNSFFIVSVGIKIQNPTTKAQKALSKMWH